MIGNPKDYSMRHGFLVTACSAVALALASNGAAQDQRANDPAPRAEREMQTPAEREMQTRAEREAPAAAPDPLTAPRLIIAISVDQFSADLFNEYRSMFRGGLARLAGGAVFPAGYQAHAATETCPGHSTILTGSHPARTGVIANNWFDLSLTRDDLRVYCSEDPTVAGTASASGRYAPSINYLLVPTLGDRMDAANPATQIVSVAGKDRAAIMMGGRQADELWWLSPTGLSSYRGVEPSPTVARISQAVVAALATPRTGLELPAQCASRDIAIPIGGDRTVGTGRFVRAGGPAAFRAFMASPEADGAVLAVAATLRADRHLGEGAATDLLAVGLSATDYVGHSFGTGGAEMCLQLLALDRELGDFFDRMDATGIDYAVVLTADHGGHDLPERNRQNAEPSAVRVDRGLSPEALSRTIGSELGLDGTLLYADGPFGDYYVDRGLTAAQKTRVMDAAVRILSAHPQVATVLRGSALAAMPIPRGNPENWSLAERARASFYAGRSGDLIVLLQPRVTPIAETGAGYVATHGSAWDYDRRVPILFWRRGMVHFEQPNPAMTVDILPTIAALIGLPVPLADIDGRCLDLISGAPDSCAPR